MRTAPWQRYRRRITHRGERGHQWHPLGHSGPRPVPNAALVSGTLADWAAVHLAEAADELADPRGELRLERFPTPSAEVPPALTLTAPLHG
ncbi:hypothetical protein ACL02R_00240 [Streptomyces sp. MS19]|uniref:hypothetical protein n=1 Tax=Streptomyces sp. MS19 TaxID=3385972 RepID=UPI00399F53C2